MTPTLARILYVEDQTDIQIIARMALVKRGGFEVRICSAGVDALAAAPAFAPDLLLLDVMMPGMDGPATLQGLRALPGTAITPAIFLTAKAEPQVNAELMALGAIGVILKPFDAMTLADTVRALWAQHHGAAVRPGSQTR